MQVINIHKRIIQQPKEKVSQLFETLATSEDLIWPYENWPALRFKDGLHVGSKGGHGRIRYTIIDFKEGKYIKFRFSKPKGLNGTHELKIIETPMIRWLHDALIVDAFDKVENYFASHNKVAMYTIWINFLRVAYKRKSIQTKHA